MGNTIAPTSSLFINPEIILDSKSANQDPMVCFYQAAEAFRKHESSKGMKCWMDGMGACSKAEQKEFEAVFYNIRRLKGLPIDHGKDIVYNFSLASDEERMHVLQFYQSSKWVINPTAQANLSTDASLLMPLGSLKDRVHTMNQEHNGKIPFLLSFGRQYIFDIGMDVLFPFYGTLAKCCIRRLADTFCDEVTAPRTESAIMKGINYFYQPNKIIIKA